MKNRPMTPTEQREIASEVHIWILDGLASKTPWTIEDLVFQGGTSLALAWDSPRFSEDLDFIVREDMDFSRQMNRVRSHVENGLQQSFPGASVEMKEKEGDHQNVYTFAVSLPGVLGKSKVKTEFWKVANEFIKGYDKNYKMVARRGRINPHIPVASLDQIQADKIVALGARDRLKWRDIYDLWFLGNTDTNILKDQQAFSSWIEATLSLYNTLPSDLIKGWRALLDTPHEDLMKKSETDLRPFLSEQLWNKLYPSQIEIMVHNLKNILEKSIACFPEEAYQGLDSDAFKKMVLEKRQSGHDYRFSSVSKLS